MGTTGGDTEYFPDMVAYLDEVVGRVVDAVDESGLRENTLILFYSDNGTDRRVVSQTIFGEVTGGKGATTNAGTHVPLIARWPGRIEAGINEDLIDSTDFLPTLREVARRPLPTSTQLDGRSFYTQLLGHPGEPRQWVFCHFDPRPGWDKDKFSRLRFARDKRFKLYDDGRLYEVPRDLNEQHPIPPADESPQAHQARLRLSDVLKSMQVPPPTD